MPLNDMSLRELESYTPVREEPDDFDAFWQATLADARSQDIDCRFAPFNGPLHTLDAFDVTFCGFAGQPIKGWLLLPKRHSDPLPTIVEYIGYGGGRGTPYDWLLWASLGYAHFVMDTRGQGSSWREGDTPDIASGGYDPHFSGFMTLGIRSPQTYYYRRLMTDAVRAVEAATTHPAVDADRLVVTGHSQGGGLTLAVAGLMGDAVKAAMPDAPYLTHYRRATEITETMPYVEIARYLKAHRGEVAQVFDTLAYFDGVNFAARATAPALFSAGLMDEVTPPSTIYAAYNHYAGAKTMHAYHYNEHDGGGSHHKQVQMDWLAELFG